MICKQFGSSHHCELQQGFIACTMCAPYPISNAELYPHIAKIPLRSHLHSGPLYCSRTQNENFVHVLIHGPKYRLHCSTMQKYTFHHMVAIRCTNCQIRNRIYRTVTRNQCTAALYSYLCTRLCAREYCVWDPVQNFGLWAHLLGNA